MWIHDYSLASFPALPQLFNVGFDRLRHTDTSSHGWGCEKVIHHASLDTSFLTDDCLHLRIFRMELVFLRALKSSWSLGTRLITVNCRLLEQAI